MNFLRMLFVATFLFTGCAELQNVKKNILGVTSSKESSFYQVKEGMSIDEMKKTVSEEPRTFNVSPTVVLYGYEDGFIITKNKKVDEVYEYRTIGANETVSDLVTLNMNTIDVIKSAGWPLGIDSNNDAHVFYYRTGTLLIKDNELINTFNRLENYAVTVNAYRGTKINQPTYYLIPSVPGIDRNSPEFLEVKEYVTQLLQENGKVTDSPDSANVILFVNFGVGDKNVDLLSYSRPVYRSVWNPGSTSTTYVQDQYGRNIGSIQSTTPSSVSTVYEGQVSTQIRVESYRRHLILEAVEANAFKKNGERKYFWKTTIESIGPDPDFRAILPVLTYAANGYIYKNSGKAVRVKINFSQMMEYFLRVFGS